jgi:hypothetical protein
MDISSGTVTQPLRARLLPLLLAVALLGALAGVPPVSAQTGSACQDPNPETYEDFGPTDITAVSGNQKMAVAVNDAATVTVMKWPSPSYYDQIKYRTTDRSEPRMGALPNEGAFVGLGYKRGSKPWRFDWLREWPSSQRFADDDSDEIVTTFRNRDQGLQVTLRDVVAAGQDSLVRSVLVKRTAASRVTQARVISFANFNPVFSKTRRSAANDSCTEDDDDEGAIYDPEVDAIVHERSGTDASTGEPSGAALIMGFAGNSDGHQVGVDTYEAGSGEGSAYDDAADARLQGAEAADGQVDTALADDISLKNRRSGSSTILIAAAFSAEEATQVLADIRSKTAAEVRADKRRWWTRWLRGSRLPKNAPASVVRLAKRSLISARQAADPRGLIVASVATQPPHGLDWIRNGAYINRMLEVAGYREMVARHNVRYAGLQATSVEKPRGGETTPPGNWSQNYYADGVVGGPIPYEIDETGLGIWTLWDHYAFTEERSYLLAVYEEIQRAAHYLSDNPPLGCRDPATGLQCSANEGDNPEMTRTLVGAQAVWLGLDAAVQAARALGTETSKQNATKWAGRRDELAEAIRANYLDEECNCYTRDYEIGGTNLWPVGFEPYGSKRSNSQAAVNWTHIARSLGGRVDRSKLAGKVLLGNAYAWQGQAGNIRRLKRGLRWMAEVPTTDATGLLGEAWMKFPTDSGKITTMVAQPNVWHQAIFYLAATKVYGTEAWRP